MVGSKIACRGAFCLFTRRDLSLPRIVVFVDKRIELAAPGGRLQSITSRE